MKKIENIRGYLNTGFSKVYRSPYFIVGIIQFLSLVPLSQARILDEVPVEDLSRLMEGNSLEYSVPVEGSRYSATVLYQIVNASAEEVAAVSFDYELQTTYFSKLTYAKINVWESPSQALVDYTIKLSAFLPAVSFQSRNQISRLPSVFPMARALGDKPGSAIAGYQNDSVLVQGSSINDLQIRFRVEPYGSARNGQSLVTVSSWIEPAIPISTSTLRDGAVDMFSGLVGQVLSEKQSHKALLQQQIATLQRAIGN